MNSVISTFNHSSRRLPLVLAFCAASFCAGAAEPQAPAAAPVAAPATPAAAQPKAAAPAATAPAPAAPATPVPATPAAATPAPAAAKTTAPAGRSAAAAKAAIATPTANAVTLDSFRIISERNIFNANRIGRTTRTENAAPAQKVDQISFVGTMETDQGLRAFFDGSDAVYRRVVRAGESVGEFKVVKIAADNVVLSRDSKEIPLRLTQQLRRPEGGDWSVTGFVASAVARPVANSTEIDPNTPAQIPADASDVLRRLMEQRQKQLKQ